MNPVAISSHCFTDMLETVFCNSNFQYIDGMIGICCAPLQPAFPLLLGLEPALPRLSAPNLALAGHSRWFEQVASNAQYEMFSRNCTCSCCNCCKLCPSWGQAINASALLPKYIRVETPIDWSTAKRPRWLVGGTTSQLCTALPCEALTAQGPRHDMFSNVCYFARVGCHLRLEIGKTKFVIRCADSKISKDIVKLGRHFLSCKSLV